MVKVREDHSLLDDGRIDIDAWLNKVQSTYGGTVDCFVMREACELSYQADVDSPTSHSAWGSSTSSFTIGLDIAHILLELKADYDALIAAVLYRVVRENKLSLQVIEKKFGRNISDLIEGVLRMAAISGMIRPSQKTQLGKSDGQLDSVRKMLVAMVDDVRVALIKLSERTCAIRAVKDASIQRQRKVAREVLDIYAPLAHRLGVGQLKWELEDLSFRYLEPESYKRIAALLDEKRMAREVYIEDVTQLLIEQLASVGIQSEISGRAKHIYSIWRKMQKKNVDFYEIYDVRAVRVLVPEVRDCYTSIGVVHALWKHVPHEFDDYIASPKENGYQSLHTAVVGPGRKMLEVQIRTKEMHEDAELGICAHWVYKETDKLNSNKAKSYEDKISWLRQVLEWQEELGDAGFTSLMEQLQYNSPAENERVYVFTPNGDVVDMIGGCTAVDFAYSVHTDVGHRCRGAKVNGRIVPLDYKLQSGEQIEIITASEGGPSRDWLVPTFNYIQSSGARAKIQRWFRDQDRGSRIAQGKILLNKEIKRLAMEDVDLDLNALAPRLNLKAKDDVLAALGAGDLRPTQIVNKVKGSFSGHYGQQELLLKDINEVPLNNNAFIVQGVNNVLTSLAACCKPVPGDALHGYITTGKGISVHRFDCDNMVRLRGESLERTVPVSWTSDSDVFYPVDVHLRSYDRQGLLKDVMSVLSSEKVNITGANTVSNANDFTATIKLTIEISGVGDLGKVLAKLEQLPNMIEVRRAKK